LIFLRISVFHIGISERSLSLFQVFETNKMLILLSNQSPFLYNSFRQRSHLKHHQAKDHGTVKEFTCEICERQFVYRYELINHAKTCHKVKDNRLFMEELKPDEIDQGMTIEFACEFCQKRFSSMSMLQDHTVAHHPSENSIGFVIENDMDMDQSNFIIEFEKN